MLQGYNESHLKSIFLKLCGRYNANYKLSLCWLICFILFDRHSLTFSYWLWRQVIPHTNIDWERTVGVTCQQRMLTPIRHLMLPVVFPGVCEPKFQSELSHVPDLSTGFDCRFFSLLDFDCGLFHLPNLNTLSLTIDIWNRAHCGCDWSAGYAHFSAAPDPTFAFVGGLRCPTFDFVIAF
jgi:hypothetical protein